MALRRKALSYGDEASQYDFESFKQYKKGERGGLKGAAKGASYGASIGGTIGSFIPVVGTAIGTGIGAVVGGTAGAIGGNAKMKQEYLRYAKEMTAAGKMEEAALAQAQADKIAEQQKMQAEKRAADAERARALYGTTTTQPIVGGEMPMYKKGGVAKMVMINVEKGELAVDPRTMKVIMDFNDVPKHPKGKDVINQKGNVKVPVGTIIIPADMRRDFLKAEPGQRIEMAAELIERQREGEEKEMEENEGMEEQAMPQGMGMAQEQMPQGQGMMAMMGGEGGEEEEGGEEMERMQYGGLVGEEKIVAEGDSIMGFKKADKNNKDVYKRWEDKTLLKYPKADKEALKEFYQRNVTPVLTKDNKVDFVENMVWYKKIHGTEDKIENYPNKINISQDMIERIKKDKSISDSLNQESDYIKYGMGGYVKKYAQAGMVTDDVTTGRTDFNKLSGNVVTPTNASIYYDPSGNPYSYNAYGEAVAIRPGTEATYDPTQNVRELSTTQPQTTQRQAGTSGTTGGGLAGGLGTSLGMIGAAIPQYYLGKKQAKEAQTALTELQKQKWAKYLPTAQLEQQSLDTAAARERAKYGFSTAELGARQQQVAQAQRTAFQRARESGLSGAGQATLAALASQRLQALNEMAIQDARLREQKAQYADSSQRSLAQQYQALANAQTAQDIRYRTMQEQAYGGALKAGLENQYGAFSTAGAGLGYAAGSGLTSLLGLI